MYDFCFDYSRLLLSQLTPALRTLHMHSFLSKITVVTNSTTQLYSKSGMYN